MKGRKPSINSPYYLPPHSFELSREYALNYDTWMAEIRALRNQSKGFAYDKDKVSSSCDYSPTESAAIDISEIQSKIDKIEFALLEASDGLEEYIRLAVCYQYTYRQLTMGRLHMPLNKNEFGRMRQKFYYILYGLI